MKYEWYLFDLDGTLTESAEGIIGCARYAIDALGAEQPPEEEMRRFIGPPLKWSFTNVAGMDEEKAALAVEKYRERYAVLGWKENRVYPGIAQLIRGIKKRGGRVALASAKPEKFCRMILEYFGLMPYFDRVSAISLDNHSADKKDIILKALPDAGERAHAVMVGDRIFDIEGALEAGVDAVGVEYGYGMPAEFEKATAVAKTPSDLWDILIGERRDRGMFVTFEGVDGSGKSTQFKKAIEWYSRCGWDMVTTREPGGCPISERIRELLLDVSSKGMTAKCEAMLYAAAREQHVQQVILPSLESGKVVLCDRFLDSSVAYQAYGRELTEPFIRQINDPAVGELKPDMTLVYMADTATARSRVAMGGAPDRMESEGDDFVGRVSAGYRLIADKEPARVRLIDGMRSIDEVFGDTLGNISELLK